MLGGLPQPKQIAAHRLTELDPLSVAILDTRAWEAFRAGHVKGSLSVPLTRTFSTDAGSLVSATEPIYLVVAESRLEEAIRDLVRVGLDNILAWCPAGEIEALPSLATVDEVDAQAAHALVESGRVRLLDVRRATEFAEGHLPGAMNIAHTTLAGRLDEIPKGMPLLVNCRSGARSGCASAYLKRAGLEIINLQGGVLAWDRETARIAR